MQQNETNVDKAPYATPVVLTNERYKAMTGTIGAALLTSGVFLLPALASYFGLMALLSGVSFAHTIPVWVSAAVLWGIALPTYWFVKPRMRRKTPDTLRFDIEGIQLTKDGSTSRYPWSEIDRAREVVLFRGRNAKITAMQIQRKGRFYAPDDTSDNVAAMQFGITEETFATMVRAGVEAWKSAPAT
jgi:hypothetical protein